MKRSAVEDYQELHHGHAEYCRESGPLNAKEKTFPALLTGLELAVAALAAAGLLHALLSFSLISTPLSIWPDRAYIEVDVRNWPEGGVLRYELSDGSGTVMDSGPIYADPQDLTLEGLQGDTEYILTYFLDDEPAETYRFQTGSEDPVSTVPTTPPTTIAATVPTATVPTTVPATAATEPVTEPSTEPVTEPTTVPTTPPATRPPETRPPETQPPETEAPPEPVTPGITHIRDIWVDGVMMYQFTQRHVFHDVPESGWELVVNEILGEYADALPPENYTVAYSQEDQTLVVECISSALPCGETSTIQVQVYLPDGTVLESTQANVPPSVQDLTISYDGVDPGTGQLLFRVSGTTMPPNVGSAQFTLQVFLGEDIEHVASVSIPTGAFDQVVPLPLSYPDTPQLIQVAITCIWQAEGIEYPDMLGNALGWADTQYGGQPPAPGNEDPVPGDDDVPPESNALVPGGESTTQAGESLPETAESLNEIILP